MRPLYHPDMDDVTVESILYAFSDPLRVQIYIQLAKAESPRSCSNVLQVEEVTLPKSTLSHHFKILREAGLIYSERKGVELQSRTRCAELKERFGGLVLSIVEAYATQFAKQKRRRKKA
jgi:DNA-binding transcriptional ArsR family regulator